MTKQRIRKSGKRLLAGILCAAMMFGEFGLAASAEEIHNAGEPTVVTESGEPMPVTEPGADQPVVTTEPDGSASDGDVTGTPGENAPTTDGAAGEETAPETTPTTPGTPGANTPGAGDAAGNEMTPVTPSTPEGNAPETETPDADIEDMDEENPEDEKEKEEKEEADAEDEEKDDVSLLAVDENFSKVVYVGTKHGADIESAAMGKSPEYPYSTLEEAYESVTNNGTIKVVDSLDVSSWPENANKNVTIDGWKGEIGGTLYNNPTIWMDGDWVLKGDTIFQKLTIKQKTTGDKIVYPEGHRLQIGSGEAETEAGQSGVVPRVEDTFIKDMYNRTNKWFVIGTGPADEEKGEHIKSVDIGVYGVQSWIAIKADAKNVNDQTYTKITTPNLESIRIEVIGNTQKNAMLSSHHWYNGMAPAFDGTNLKKVEITMGYGSLAGSYAIFRNWQDSTKRSGNFSMKYTLDNVTVEGGEAIVFGEAYTTGNITIDLWDTHFTNSSKSSFALGTFGGKFGEVQINLHNSSLKGLGNHYEIKGGRNTSLSYDKFILTLDNSHITDYTAFQDEMEITMSGDSSIGKLCYYPKTGNEVQTRCIVKNTGKGTLGFIEKNPIEIENQSGAELVLTNTTSNISNVENNGTIHIEQSQSWQGNYTGGTEDAPGQLTLLTGTTLDIKGEVSGITTALAEETENTSKIAAITAGSGKKECIRWENTEGNPTNSEGYWAINLGKEDYNQENCIYIRYSGSDSNAGTSYQNAVKSFHKAYELAFKEKKKIVVCDGYYFYDECTGGHNEQTEVPVIVTTHDGTTDFEQLYGAKLMIATGSSTNSGAEGMSLKHAFQFENITITGTSPAAEKEYLEIYANGHPTVMGNNVHLIPYTSVYGGSVSGEVTNTKLTILDGTYFRIYGGNYNGTVKGTIDLTVNNAVIRTPGYGSEFTICIAGGSRGGTVEADINLNVSANKEEGQKITGVKRILGGNYMGSLKGDINLNISGAVSFDEKIPTPVKCAIIGGNFASGKVNGNVTLTVQDIEGTGTPYIVGGNGRTNNVEGNVSMTVDGVQAYRIVGGSGWTNPSGDVANSKVTGDILMNIGLNTPVQSDSIYGCGGDMGDDAPAASNKEYKPNSMTMNLGQVSAGVVSGGIIGVSVSAETRKVLSLNIQANARIRELQEFSNVVVNDGSTLTYDGTMLTSDTLKNNGTIQYQEGSVSVQSNYQAGENAKIQLNSYATVTHEKGVTGVTKVASLKGEKALTVRAVAAENGEAISEEHFIGDEIGLVYQVEEDTSPKISVWKYDSIGAGTRDFVYVDGQKGNDEWDGTKPQQAADGTTGEGGEEITSGPVQTLERAYEIIKDGGSIIVCGKTEISRWPNVQKKAFITSDAALVSDSGDTTDYRSENIDEQGAENTGLFFKPGTGSKYLLLEDDLTLRNLDFHYTYNAQNGGIDANGYKLIIGDKSDTGADVTEIKPDVRFYKIQDGKRVKPNTFLLVGGGIARKELEQIHLEVYNTEVKTVIGLWGGSTETDQSVVKGNVNLILQDCKTSKKNVHYCSNDTLIDLTSDNLFNGGYGVINGDANVSIAFYNNDMNNAFPGSLYGLKRVKNMRNGTLHYINATPHMWQMGVTTTAGMFHAAEKCNIIYESNGNGDIRFDTLFPVDSNTTLDGGENPQVEITLLGKVYIMNSALIAEKAEMPNLSVVLNLGNEERGSERISFKDNQLVNVPSETNYKLNSYRINFYSGANVKFDMVKRPNVTTVENGRPVVVLHSLKEDLENKRQTEYIIDEPDFVGHAVLECNNSKVVCNTDLSSKLFDLRLVNGGSFTYDKDDFELNGSLSMAEGTELNTNGTVSIEKDLRLENNAEFRVENLLDVKGKIESESGAALLVNNGAMITVGGASGETRVDFNGIADKGHFEIKASKGENSDSTESYDDKRFTGGTDIEGTPITLTYEGKTDSYVTWTYGEAKALDEIFLSDRGLNENSGERPGEAVKTFETALERAVEGESSKTEIKIVISGKYTFQKERDGAQIDSELLEKLEGKDIIVTQQVESTGSTYKSNVSIENGFEIPLNLTFENIRLSFAGSNPEFYAGGKVLTIGEGVTVLADGKYPIIYGGRESGEVNGDTEVNVYSGTWFRVYGGGKAGSVTGDTKVTLGDALGLAPNITTGTEEHENFSPINTNAVFGGGKDGKVTGTAQVIVNYGENYGYIFGGSESGTVGATEVTVNHKDVKIQRIYGGSYSGKVTGKAQVNFKSGNVNRIYGGGISSDATAASTEVNIGCAGKAASSAIVNHYLRGSGAQGGVTGEAYLNIMDGAYIGKDCNAAAGGYTGGVARSILNINGGEIHTDIYAGGAGEFKSENGTLLDEIDPTKGIVSASEVHVTGGTVHGSVYGGGNMGSVGTAGTKDAGVLTTAEITNGIIEGDFYGGGSLAPTYGNINMTLKMSENAKVGGGIFGGGKGRAKELGKQGVSADVKGTTTVTVTSAHAGKGVYGGCNLNGNVDKTQVTVTAPTDCGIYGGGFGADTYAETTNVDLNLSETFAAESENTQAAAVYGGGEQGQTGTSHVTVRNWKGNVYGGGRGAAEDAGVITSVKNVFRTIGNAGAVLFTGEKAFDIDGLKDANTKETHVTVSGILIGNAYGGGELATVGVEANGDGAADTKAAGDGSTAASVTNVVIEDGASVTGNVYGGGKGREKSEFAKIYGDTSVQMKGGTVQQEVAENPVGGCIFGGGEIAPVGGNTNVMVSAGTVHNVFGGNDQSGQISGNTNVTITAAADQNGTEGANTTNVTNVYGGGRDAAYGVDAAKDAAEVSTHVVINGGTVENAYGGGFGASAVCQNTSLTINGGYTEMAFAGGNAATVDGKAELTVNVPQTGGSGSEEATDADQPVANTDETALYAGADVDTEDNTDVNTDVFEGTADVQTVFAGNNQAAMNIQPTIHLQSGKIGTFYGGGNQGNMTKEDGISYGEDTFGSDEIFINTVYGGCNNADVTYGVTLELSKGTYGEVYGGNNVDGEAHQSQVILNGDTLEVNTVYGGGNQASIENASVTALKGKIQTIYGGGNSATATESVSLAVGQKPGEATSGSAERTAEATAEGTAGDTAGSTAENVVENAVITNLYCGNNQAVMNIAPTIDMQKGTVTNFFGGGNRGAMEPKENESLELKYTFDSDEMEITNLYGGGNQADVVGEIALNLAAADIENAYGGCNEANVKGKATLTLTGADVENTYGGCNTSGQVDTSEVIVSGSGTHTVYGGGQGKNTNVVNANVEVQNGTVEGNIYGGSGYGKVENSNVIVKEANATDKIDIQKSVYGGGYGESSVVTNSNVIIDMKLAIASEDNDNADLIVKEAPAEEVTDPATETEPGDAPSGETKTTIEWKKGQEEKVSIICGSVYGGGDMGKVGDGSINVSTNTADIDTKGSTHVQVNSGHIKGSVFGGGSGTPAANLSYTAYMGTVFGSCKVDVRGGYVEGSIYGCGHQSRVYAPQDEKAAVVNIKETPVSGNIFKAENAGSIIVGTSVFGGGNKGEGNNQNASVYTVIGDTEVNIEGVESKQDSTAIYFLSESKGGVYGDGNLCLVNGNRVVNLIDFNYGSEKKGLLKTFYSLQRADEVNLIRSRVVLRGAKDLVDETADDTEYAINRVGQINMNQSSALKLTTVVNLLGGLTSDQNTKTTYIDRGNNGKNGYDDRGGQKSEDVLKDEQISEYREAYLHFLNKGGSVSSNYTSFNVVCVANGSYLEIKKSDTEYGAVKGLFTLELLHANPGEGGGFVYADIGTREAGSGSTGDFICTTPNENDKNEDYMEVRDTVGGYTNRQNGGSGDVTTGDYTYYYWYIKGGKYTYNTNLKGYIGTTETDFDTSVNLMTLDPNYHYILNSITGEGPVAELNDPNSFCDSRFVDEWTEACKSEDKYAIEVRIVPGGTGKDLKPKSIGFLSYGNYGTGENASKDCWGIRLTDSNNGTDSKVIVGTGNENETDLEKLKANDIYTVSEGTTGLSLQFILHKGTGVTTEFKDVELKLTFDVIQGKEGGGYEPGNGGDNAHLTVNTFTSITRLVPTQAAYIGSGRLYAGVTSDIPVQITKNSAFTAQFITKFVPSAFNTDTLNIEEVLTTGVDELYLLDEETGVGFTVVDNGQGPELRYATEGNPSDYTLSKADDIYQVTFNEKQEDGSTKEVIHKLIVQEDIRRKATPLPEGTVITLVAQIDDHTPTYWYYYCTTENLSEIPLSEFRRMGSTGEKLEDKYSFANASGGKISATSSNRVTENLTFVFDFSNVTEETANDYPWLDDTSVDGALMLRHRTRINSVNNVDIMDYVSSTSRIEAGNSQIIYTREHPAVTKTFDVSKTENGLKEFTVAFTDEDEHYTKDTYQIGITIEEDEDFINTQYEEREYAVVLQQMDGNGTDAKVIPFPEGTMFRYNGENIIAGNQNRSVIIPVKKAGSHEIEMETTLEGFPVGENGAGEVCLKATLYSSSVASYYNNLDTGVERTRTFNVSERPEAALKIVAVNEGSDGALDESTGEAIEKQIFAGGDTVMLNIQSISSEGQSGQAANASGKAQSGSDGTDVPLDTQSGTVRLYKYERKQNSKNQFACYSKLELTEVFDDAAASFVAGKNGTEWKALIKSNASPGTYRLEFRYEDKTEYWDFVVKE